MQLEYGHGVWLPIARLTTKSSCTRPTAKQDMIRYFKELDPFQVADPLM